MSPPSSASVQKTAVCPLVGIDAVFLRVRAHIAYGVPRVLYLRGEWRLSRVAVLRDCDGEALFDDFVEAADRHIKVLLFPRRALHVDEAGIFSVGLVPRYGQQYVEAQRHAAGSRVFDFADEPHARFVPSRLDSPRAFGGFGVFGEFFICPFFYFHCGRLPVFMSLFSNYRHWSAFQATGGD